MNEISNRIYLFCWLLTSLCSHTEVSQATNKDTVWEKRCIPYNLKLFFTSEGTTPRSPNILFSPTLLLLVWLKRKQVTMRVEIIQQISVFPFHWHTVLPNTHTHIHTIKGVHTCTGVYTLTKNLFFESERERALIASRGWWSAYLPRITRAKLCSANKACFDR